MITMNFFTFLLSVTLVIAAEGHGMSPIEAEVAQLKAMMQEQQHMIQEQHTLIQRLQQWITDIDNERNSNGQIFDCFRTEDWTTDGIITFNGCTVDTTTSHPWKGTFTVQDSGIYRFTFEGLVFIPIGSFRSFGSVNLLVDGNPVAAGYVEENMDGIDNERYFMVSVNTLQALEVGQNVSITWTGVDGEYLYSDIQTYVHFTGHNLASSTLVPPQCEYTGQTFEYPGSCRKYYLCLADGTIELDDCCPDVFDPIGEICIPEEDGGNLCNDVDTC